MWMDHDFLESGTAQCRVDPGRVAGLGPDVGGVTSRPSGAAAPPQDVEPDRADDDEYLAALIPAVQKALDEFRPDICFYVGGADPYCEDQLGGLSLTKAGLMQRDRQVFEEARRRKIPVATVLAGGYARRVEDTIRIHVNTILAAQEVVESHPQSSSMSG